MKNKKILKFLSFSLLPSIVAGGIGVALVSCNNEENKEDDTKPILKSAKLDEKGKTIELTLNTLIVLDKTLIKIILENSDESSSIINSWELENQKINFKENYFKKTDNLFLKYGNEPVIKINTDEAPNDITPWIDINTSYLINTANIDLSGKIILLEINTTKKIANDFAALLIIKKDNQLLPNDCWNVDSVNNKIILKNNIYKFNDLSIQYKNENLITIDTSNLSLPTLETLTIVQEKDNSIDFANVNLQSYYDLEIIGNGNNDNNDIILKNLNLNGLNIINLTYLKIGGSVSSIFESFNKMCHMQELTYDCTDSNTESINLHDLSKLNFSLLPKKLINLSLLGVGTYATSFENLDFSKLPKTLKNLNFLNFCYFIKNFTNLNFSTLPNDLETFTFNCVGVYADDASDFKLDTLPKNIKKIFLYNIATNAPITTFKLINLPQNLNTLKLDTIGKNNDSLKYFDLSHLPSNLTTLYITDVLKETTDMTGLDLSKLPIGLQSLTIWSLASKCNNTNWFEFSNLPYSLKYLELRYMWDSVEVPECIYGELNSINHSIEIMIWKAWSNFDKNKVKNSNITWK